ncbi:MAG: hypothetical protein BGO67_08255 [Alphaproteobacteria bacterium 41-28]|nr:MAG: hypothetical protein BGO67_08255 [Alphaproteobacteria bacterium 41-28]
MKNILMSASLLTVFFVSQDSANAAEEVFNPTVTVGQTLKHLATDNQLHEVYCTVLSSSTASASAGRDQALYTSPIYIYFKGLQAGSTSYACHLDSVSGPILIKGEITVKQQP